MKPSSSGKRKSRDKASRSSRDSSTKLFSAKGSGRLRPSAWQWAGGSVLAAAALLRLIDLTLKPLHHDEGVNGMFMANLFRGGYYHYDPSNFHGPTLYYFGWITTTINSFIYGSAGLSTFAIRLVTALFGIGIVWLILLLRRQMGTFGALSAAALATVSPGFVYFSRYFIHEILFAFFSLAVVVAVLQFKETAQPRYLMLASVSAALLCATKETWVITVAVWLIALPCTGAYLYLQKNLQKNYLRKGLRRTPPERQAAGESRKANERDTAPQDEARAMPAWSITRPYVMAALLFAVVWVLFYSSFFSNFPQGVYDSFRTFGYWFKTGESANVYSWSRYLEWLWQEEAPAVLLGSLGIVIAFWQARNRFAVIVAFWSLGSLAAYCPVPYKTPWCALNILLPFIVMAGYGLEQCYQRLSLRVFAPFVAGAGVLFSLYQAVDLRFFRDDDDSLAYGDAHTRRDFVSLVDAIDFIASGNPAGKDIGIVVMSPEHWPLPWYLRDYPRAGFWSKVIETSEPILIVHENQIGEVEQLLGDKYRRFSSHELRPGNQLYLYLRRDLQP